MMRLLLIISLLTSSSVGADRHLPLLSHFLQHWIVTLGVLPHNVHPDVHTGSLDAKKQVENFATARKIIEAAHVPLKNVDYWVGHFDSLARKARFDQHLKMALPEVNSKNHSQSTKNVWIALADVDEFPQLEPGESLAERLTELDRSGFNMCTGANVDRVAADGSLETTPKPETPLVQQYPLKCNMTADCERCKSQKVVAYKVLGHHSFVWFPGGDEHPPINTCLVTCLLIRHHAYKVGGSSIHKETTRCPPLHLWIEIWHFKWWGNLQEYLEDRRNNQGNGMHAAVGMLKTVADSRIDTERYCQPITSSSDPFDMESSLAHELRIFHPPCLDTEELRP